MVQGASFYIETLAPCTKFRVKKSDYNLELGSQFFVMLVSTLKLRTEIALYLIFKKHIQSFLFIFAQDVLLSTIKLPL